VPPMRQYQRARESKGFVLPQVWERLEKGVIIDVDQNGRRKRD